MTDPNRLNPGQEQHERYFSGVLKRYLVRYDYRDFNGKLYSGTGKNYREAKEKAMRTRKEAIVA